MDYLASADPRIVGLQNMGSPNLLADVADLSLDTPYGVYRYLGGPRLWHAPESTPRSYVSDVDGLVVSDPSDDVVLEGRAEPGSGIRKRIEIRLVQGCRGYGLLTS